MIELKIYCKNDKNKVEKILQAEGYDLMLGTVEDFMRIIDVDKLDNSVEVAKMIVKGYSKLRPLLRDVFPDVTDEELDCVKVSEMVQTIVQIGIAIADSLKELKSGNVRRA